jgi:hypothetical protein
MFLHSDDKICEVFCQMQLYIPNAPTLKLAKLGMDTTIFYIRNSCELKNPLRIHCNPQFKKLCVKEIFKVLKYV